MIKDPELKKVMQNFARAMSECFEGRAFVLLISGFDDPTAQTHYIANCRREDSIKLLRGLADSLELQMRRN